MGEGVSLFEASKKPSAAGGGGGLTRGAAALWSSGEDLEPRGPLGTDQVAAVAAGRRAETLGTASEWKRRTSGEVKGLLKASWKCLEGFADILGCDLEITLGCFGVLNRYIDAMVW